MSFYFLYYINIKSLLKYITYMFILPPHKKIYIFFMFFVQYLIPIGFYPKEMLLYIKIEIPASATFRYDYFYVSFLRK
jgi:hypothetical protein